jgi:hypothetical protein
MKRAARLGGEGVAGTVLRCGTRGLSVASRTLALAPDTARAGERLSTFGRSRRRAAHGDGPRPGRASDARDASGAPDRILRGAEPSAAELDAGDRTTPSS